MGLDSIAAVQARIQEIDAIINSTSSSATASTSPTSTSSDGAQSADFAALLASMSGTDGSTDPLSGSSSGTSDPSSMLSALNALGLNTSGTNSSSLLSALGGATSSAGQSSPIAQNFLQTALAQAGKPYVYGADPSPSNANPTAFDCEGLTKWAAARQGITIPAGATAQYLYIRDHGTTMSVDQALHTPGALLFHFGHEPKNLGDIPADGHVAISVGDGVHTIEARGHAYGTNVFDASGVRSGFFNYAGMIPGM